MEDILKGKCIWKEFEGGRLSAETKMCACFQKQQ
jgi:hypothetical protein